MPGRGIGWVVVVDAFLSPRCSARPPCFLWPSVASRRRYTCRSWDLMQLRTDPFRSPGAQTGRDQMLVHTARRPTPTADCSGAHHHPFWPLPRRRRAREARRWSSPLRRFRTDMVLPGQAVSSNGATCGSVAEHNVSESSRAFTGWRHLQVHRLFGWVRRTDAVIMPTSTRAPRQETVFGWTTVAESDVTARRAARRFRPERLNAMKPAAGW